MSNARTTSLVHQEHDADRGGRQLHRLADAGLFLGHELRSCLSSILISSELLARPELCIDPDVRNRQIAAIRSAVTHAGELLRFVEASTATPAAAPPARITRLQVVLEAVSQELEGRARTANVRLIFPTSLLPWSVDAAVARLALSNLLVNAIKYADAAKAARWVTVRVSPVYGDGPTALMMEIADNGLGIPADLQQLVLLRSYRAHPQIAEGAGLGLALTRERLAQHGGSLHLVSEAGVGTTVRVTLRILPMDSADT